MTARLSALVLVALTLASSLAAAGILLQPAAAQAVPIPRPQLPEPDLPTPEDLADDPEGDGPFGIFSNDTSAPADHREAPLEEWEEQVATDARGDVLVHYPGSVDLYYLAIGELHAWSLGEPYILLRVGYNITTPNSGTVPPPQALPAPVSQLPDQIDDRPLVTINITFNISAERTVTISLYTDSYGTSWFSNQGLLVADRGNVEGHREVLYFAPLRRFSLEEGDTLSDYNITSYRGTRLVDTMEAFDPLNDPLPRYVSAKSLFDVTTSAAEQLLPIGPPGPPAAPFPIPPPLPVGTPPTPEISTEPRDYLPDDYPYPPETGPQGVPHVIGTPAEWEDWAVDAFSGRDRPAPVYPDEAGVEATDLARSSAFNITHEVTEGQTRFIARVEREIVGADHSQLAYANVTIENLFEETDQRVVMLVVAPERTRWLMRYALDMPDGIKELPAGGTVEMGMIAVPENLFATPRWTAQIMFLSDWGGLDIVQVQFVSLLTDPRDQQPPGGNGLPSTLLVDLVNQEDPFRVNEPRNVMVQVRDQYGRYVSGMDAVRAYVYPAGGRPHAPYQLHEKPFMDGVYQIPFTFNRPGAWQVDVYFFDYDANSEGAFPNIDFRVRVDYPADTSPIVPVPAALGGVALVFAAISVRERLAKAR